MTSANGSDPSTGGSLARRWLVGLGWIPLALAGFAAWLLWPVAATESDPTQDFADTDAVAVRVAVEPARLAELALEAEATGTLEPWRSVELSTELGGRLTHRQVMEGERVTAGTLLVALDPTEHTIELAEAEAELLRVQANYAVFVTSSSTDESLVGTRDDAQSALDEEVATARTLFDQGLIAERDLEAKERKRQVHLLLSGARRDDVQAATTGLIQAEQRVERARLALDRTRLLAPFDGRVADLTVEAGQRIGAGEPCLTLLDEQRMTVDVQVLEADVVRLRVGSPAEVRVPALDDRRFAARVLAINPRVDRDSGTARVRVVLDNPEGALMAGLFASVRLETGRLRDRLLVPNEAVLVRQGRSVVFRVEDDRALWTYVDVGTRAGEQTVVESGLEAGDRVAVAGHYALSHEARVAVVDAATLTPGAGG